MKTKTKTAIGLIIFFIGITFPFAVMFGMSIALHEIEASDPVVTDSPTEAAIYSPEPTPSQIICTPIIIYETIYVTQDPVPTPTPEVIYVETTPVPTDILEVGVWYKGVATSFSDYNGCRGDVLQKGDCAVGRRNYILKDSSGNVVFDEYGYTQDAGIPVYKFKYIPYGSKLAVRLSNGRVLYLTVRDDCYSTNEEKLPQIQKWNPNLDWDGVELWVDVWEDSKEESDAFGIRNVEIMILEWGEWNPEDK